MNTKALAALVGTLSLGTLATGCVTTKPAQQTDNSQDSKATEGQGGKKGASSTSEAGCTAYDPGKGGK